VKLAVSILFQDINQGITSILDRLLFDSPESGKSGVDDPGLVRETPWFKYSREIPRKEATILN
jgi:hypothetical protein